ncbi:SQUALENE MONOOXYGENASE [Salix purpurea]|uniref:Squalene monooxygenase n=1 Tax=Salix purpurea TaxID=77065 RepID=A0A9Q0PCT1_SALPP|nr:SQUALENE MONOOXYGENASE [Salix purpurea]
MADQCMQGWILATLSVLFATCCLLIKKKERGTKKDLLESRSKSVNCTATANEECISGIFSDADVIIVGAGVAGAALAHTLGKMATGNILQSLKKSCHAVIEIEDGRRVRVIERDLTEPDRIVGELLQPGGYLNLIELGLEDCVEKIDAQKVFGYALFKDGKHTRLSYPLEKFHSDVAGRSFHNGRFIQRMREKAVSLPNVQLEQGTVTSLLEEKGTVRGVQYKTKRWARADGICSSDNCL